MNFTTTAANVAAQRQASMFEDSPDDFELVPTVTLAQVRVGERFRFDPRGPVYFRASCGFTRADTGAPMVRMPGTVSVRLEAAS